MKLVPTTEKVQIKLFVYSMGEKMPHTSSMRGNWGFDFVCSCGYESKTGGAVRSWINEAIQKHKWLDHDYSWKVGN
jgi:hypothetical protein